jgi:hypothetical protein
MLQSSGTLLHLGYLSIPQPSLGLAYLHRPETSEVTGIFAEATVLQLAEEVGVHSFQDGGGRSVDEGGEEVDQCNDLRVEFEEFFLFLISACPAGSRAPARVALNLEFHVTAASFGVEQREHIPVLCVGFSLLDFDDDETERSVHPTVGE